MRTLITAIMLAISTLAYADNRQSSLIPLPQKWVVGTGEFTFAKTLTVYAPDYEGDSIGQVVRRFGEKFTRATQIPLKAAGKRRSALLLTVDTALGAEAYTLSITPKRIRIGASHPAGFFYALQTLQQLLPSRHVAAGVATPVAGKLTLPAVEIADAPRFGWRGFMLDEGRHFFGKQTVKKVLDLMAQYKLNRFHWHLTEDQGWRIEIKKYPKLTSVGGWRNSKGLGWGGYKPDGQRYGGFYTQEEVREIVAYAAERFIEIVPEIDIPGHSQAAVAAYPELLACDEKQEHGVWLWQGVSDDVINVAKPEAVAFAKDVIDELTELFPYNYLHLGGDECPTDKWQKNADCQQRLKDIHSTQYRDLQLDFYRQLQQHIAQKPKEKQRRLVFWNEVMYGNTALMSPDITIMAWVGADKAAKAAASKGLNTILSPQIPYYINRKQSKLATEPHSQGRGTETVEAVYAYTPLKDVPAQLQGRYLGVQANFWSEWVEDSQTLFYLMLPRLAAVAEAAWTPQQLRSYPSFAERLQAEAQYYRFMGVDFGRHVFR